MNKIIEEARSWLGTKFHHLGRKKISDYDKGGCDCFGLIIGVAKKLNLLSYYYENNQYKLFSEFDKKYYSFIPNYIELEEILQKSLLKIDKSEIKAGDILLMNINNRPQHLAIYNDKTIIHCHRKARKVIEEEINEYLYNNIICGWRFNVIDKNI